MIKKQHTRSGDIETAAWLPLWTEALRCSCCTKLVRPVQPETTALVMSRKKPCFIAHCSPFRALLAVIVSSIWWPNQSFKAKRKGS